VLPPLIENFTSNIVNNALSWKRTKVKWEIFIIFHKVQYLLL
jgi:hypothetical protein